MINQILNRHFVLDQLRDVQEELKRLAADDRRRGSMPEEARELTKNDFDEAVSLLEENWAKELESPSGQPGFNLPESRRGEDGPEIDDVSFFSRNPVISNLQSALEEYIEERDPHAIKRIQPTGRRSRKKSEFIITDRELKDARIREAPKGRRLFDKFSITDIRWASCLFAMGIRKFRDKHTFNPKPATPRPIANKVRLIIFGDWGSGLPRAQKVSTEISKILHEGETNGIEQHVIHLGDVYYSGWGKEYKNRFLRFWPVKENQKDAITSWSLNANHDMYSGGHAYYETLLRDLRFRSQEKSSFFSLANRNWRILGLDTGWDDGGLKEPQPEWVREQAEEAKRAGQKVMLLSHHQLFSVFEEGKQRLAALLEDSLMRGLIHSWIWGHEHRCILYGPYKDLQFSACLGHGGVPVYMTHKEDSPLPQPATYEYRNSIKSGLESWALFGFAVLDLSNNYAGIRLIDENGYTHRSEIFDRRGRVLSSYPVGAGDKIAGDKIPEIKGRRGFGAGLPDVPKGKLQKDVAMTLEDEMVTVRRTPHMAISETQPLPLGSVFNVSIYADQQQKRPGERSDDIVIVVPEEIIELEVKTQLLVSPHFVIFEKDLDTLLIDRTKSETKKVMFKLQVRSEDEIRKMSGDLASISRGSITAVFSYNGRPSGKVSRVVSIDIPAETEEEEDTGETKKIKAPSIQLDLGAKPADLTVWIHADPINNGRQFRCRVSSSRIKIKNDNWVPWNLPSVSNEIVKSYMAYFVKDDLSARERRAHLEGAGIRLFDAAPENFKNLFWQLVDSKQNLESIAIVSDEPFIPWELMIPHRKKNKKTETRAPLGVEFMIGRWTPDNGTSGSQKIPLDSSVVIAPEYKGNRALPHAQDEAEFVRNNISGTILKPAKFDVIDDKLMTSPKTNVLHISCHGAESTDVSQVIYLEDDSELHSHQLEALPGFRRFFEDSNIIVVLNACEVGRPSPALVGIGGFAKAFIDLGAAAVVAPLWSVKDDIAHDVILTFYNTVLKDPSRPFADVFRQIRSHSYLDQEAEDTYASYCFYGDPLANAASKIGLESDS